MNKQCGCEGMEGCPKCINERLEARADLQRKYTTITEEQYYNIVNVFREHGVKISFELAEEIKGEIVDRI